MPHSGTCGELGESLGFVIDGSKVYFPRKSITQYDGRYLNVPQWLSVDRGVAKYALT